MLVELDIEPLRARAIALPPGKPLVVSKVEEHMILSELCFQNPIPQPRSMDGMRLRFEGHVVLLGLEDQS